MSQKNDRPPFPSHEAAIDSVLKDERYFRRRGLPTLIEDYSATEDILTRAWPWLGVLFLIQVTRSIATSWTPGLASAILAGSLVAVVAAWVIFNRRRSRPPFALPTKVGWWSAAVFVIVPSLMRINRDNGVEYALRHIGFNLLVCALVVGVIGWGLTATIFWALVRLIGDVGHQLVIVFRQMSAIFLFCFLLFFNQEMWQFATVTDDVRYSLLGDVLTVFAVLMVIVGTPRLTRHLQRDLLEKDESLTWAQRANLTILFTIRQLLQLYFIFLATALVFILLSVFVVGEQLYQAWSLEPQIVDTFAYRGQTFILTVQGVRMSIVLALVATVNFAVLSLTSSEGRENFLEGVEEEISKVFERLRAYRRTRNALKEAGVSLP